MGVFDDMAAILGKGMDAADRKSQILKFQGELSRLEGAKTEMFAALGRDVLQEKREDEEFLSRYAERIKAIAAIEQQERETRKRIDELNAAENLATQAVSYAAGTAGVACPTCGFTATADSLFCPSCGRSLSDVRATPPTAASTAAVPTLCPQCGSALEPDALFCGNCGFKR